MELNIDENSNDVDHTAIINVNIENAKSELNDFAYVLSNKMKERIASIGMPIGDKLTTLSLLDFNTFILIKYQPK
jgi:hypothetical protein